MKNRLLKYTFVFVLLFTFMIKSYQAADIVVGSSGVGADVIIPGPKGTPCKTNCIYLSDSKKWWKAAGGGVRYSFVDKNGEMATQFGFKKSYNFKTKTYNNTYYNSNDGDASKKAVLTGSGLNVELGNPSWPTHQDLAAAYNNAVSSHGAFIQSLVGATPQAAPSFKSQNNGWKGYGSYDFQFFKFFKENSDTKSFVANFIALIYAVKESYGETLSDEVAKEIAGKACKDDIDLYIIIEPMMGFALGSYTQDPDGTKKYCEQYKSNHYAYSDCLNKQAGKHGYKYTTTLRVVGTLADLGRMMFNELDGRLDSDIGSSTYRNASEVYLGPGNGYRNKAQVAWINGKSATIYNTQAIPWFGVSQRFDRVLAPGFYYTPDFTTYGYMNYNQFVSTVATGQGMWGLSVAVGSDSCDELECNYVDGVLTSNNPKGSWKELPAGTKFKNLAEFAFAPQSENGLDCCESLKSVLTDGELKGNAEWDAAYKKYCDDSTVCKVIDDRTIQGPGKKQYSEDDYPKSGFKDFGDFVTDKKKRGGLDCCEEIKGKGGKWDEYYNTYCDSCCTENPIPKSDKYDGELNNCCLDNDTSVLQQTNVTDLFCYHNGKQVDDFYPKCNADTYVEKNINEYCDLYCSERIMIKQARPITAVTGRYFSFTEIETDIGKKTTAPYMKAFKRCSVTTEWDSWYAAYKEQVDKLVKSYNEFQRNNAFLDLYKAAKDNVTDVTVVGSRTCTCGSNSDTKPSKTSTYKIYTFPQVKKQYFQLKLDEGKEKSYEALTLVNDGGPYFAEHTQYTNDDYDTAISKATPDSCSGTCTVNGKTESYSGSASYTFNGSSTAPAGSITGSNSTKENFTGVLSAYEQAVTNAKQNFGAAKNQMKHLEELLNQCEGYFSGSSTTLEDGSDITKEDQKIYQLDPKLDFHYTQVVLNENGKKVSDKVKIDFVPINEETNKACEFTGPIIVSDNGALLSKIGYTPKGKGSYVTSDDELKSAAYSSIYSPNGGDSKYYELMMLFKVDTLTKTASSYDEDLLKDMNDAKAYKAQKKFNEFAKYKADCVWIDKGTAITLYPSGLIGQPLNPGGLDEKIENKNITSHDREYAISTRTLQGSYQTNWNLTGVGEKGKFDKYIQEKGTACSMTDKSSFNPSTKEDEWRFTCKIVIRNSTIRTGLCEPSAIVAPVDNKNMEPCDPADYIQPSLKFKIVDSNDLFPNTTKSDKGFTDAKNNTYGYNWVTDEGKEAYDKITADSNAGVLFSPDHLSEVIRLNSQGISLIKQYNSKVKGGYSDFNLTCECEENIASTEPDNKLPEDLRAGCVKCKSKFLEDLQDGKITIDGNSHDIHVWVARKDWTLDKIRTERLGW